MADDLAKCWAEVLDCSEKDIQDDSDFFKMGGDSVGAIRLCGIVRHKGIILDAQTVFENPVFADLKEKCKSTSETDSSEEAGNDSSASQESTKKSNGKDLLRAYELVSTLLDQCHIDGSLLVDILPCAPFQAELMRASHENGLWGFQSVFELKSGNKEHARKTMETLREDNAVFRTRIAQYGTDLYQVVLKDPITWHEESVSLETYKLRDMRQRMTYGSPLCRYAIIHDQERTFFVWTKTHAIYDRWSKMAFIDDLHSCFEDPEAFAARPKRPAMREYIDAISSMDTEAGVAHWKSKLEGLERWDLLVPGAKQETFIARSNNSLRRTIEYKKPQNTAITFSAISHVAWALCMANECQSNDIFYIAFRSGRQLAIPGVEDIIGPLWSTVPVRMQLDTSQTLADLLQTIHKDIVSGTRHEPFGVQACKEHFGHNRYLQSALLPQPPQPATFEKTAHAKDVDGNEVSLQSVEKLWTQADGMFGCYIMLTPKGKNLELWCRFDETFIDSARASKLLEALATMLSKITNDLDWEKTTVQDLCPHLESTSQEEASPVKHAEGPSTLRNLLPTESDNSLAVVVPGEKPLSVKYQDLQQHIESFQKDLATLGIDKDSAVSIVLGNTYEIVVAFLATTWQRGIAAPLNHDYKQDEFEFYIDDLGSSLVLVQKGKFEEDGPAIKAARKYEAAIAEVYWDGKKVVLDVKEKGKLEKKDGVEVSTAGEDDTALVLHTSGTTGRPKAVPLTHKNLITNIDNICETYKLTPTDRTMLIMPLFHVHGLLASFLSPLRSGGAAIIPSRLTPSFWNQFKKHKATWYTATPTMHRLILKFPTPDQLPSIRFIRSCSSQLAPAVFHQLEEKFKAPVLESYAMTEASHLMTSNPLHPAKRMPGCVGRADHLELRILDNEGNHLNQGEEGEVCIKGENVTKGYLNNPDANKSSFTDEGFFRTGDQGKLDEDGYLFLTGRLKEMINKGGEKISPVELDNVIAQHEDIAEAVSFGIDDEDYGQNVGCAIKLKEGKGLDDKAVKKWLGERISAFKVPKKVWFPDEIPKTATGKLQRKKVAEAMLAKD